MTADLSALGGTYAAALTLFTRREAVDHDAWASYLAWLCQGGLDGVLVMGTTGDFPLLRLGEREALIHTAAQAVPRERRLMVNVGAMTTREAARLAERAVESARPADLILAGPPYYYQATLTGERLTGHLRDIASACAGVPLLYYHIPRMSHFDPGVDGLSEAIAGAPLAGIKDSDGVHEFQRRVRERHGPASFLYLNGNIEAVLRSWNELQGQGAILGLAAALPFPCAMLWKKWRAGELDDTRLLHTSLCSLWSVVKRYGNAGIRALLAMLAPLKAETLATGRRPFAEVPEAGRAEIAEALRVSGFGA